MTVFIPFIIFYWAFCTLFLLGGLFDDLDKEILTKFEQLCIRTFIVLFAGFLFPVIIGDRFGKD